MISIVDYGMGNLESVQKALAINGAETRLVETASQIEESEKLILPGVGAFGEAMHHLRDQGMVEALRTYARSGRPLLGVCLGLQLLFESSDEAPGVDGLGILPGTVKKFPASIGLKIPHMGWNNLQIAPTSRLFASLPADPYVYFVHSYYVEPADPAITAALTQYGITFVSAIERDNIFGAQFHPEKSQTNGLAILKTFAGISVPIPQS